MVGCNEWRGRKYKAPASILFRNILLIIVVTVITQTIVSPSSSALARKPSRKTTMKQKLVQEAIVPDVIDEIPESPNVTIQYPGGVSVTYGNELTPTQVKDVPTVDWSAKDDELYMVAMVDPDAPSRKEPKFRHWLHWLVVNVPGKDLTKGETIAEYVGSGPPEGTGLHRYVFLVYAQKDHRIQTSLKLTNTSAAGRGNFSIREFAGQHHSKPVAANFYQAKYDDYVPTLYKQLRAV